MNSPYFDYRFIISKIQNIYNIIITRYNIYKEMLEVKLNFTGRGAMLYPQEGNTAAYFEDEKGFFLIDCGEDVAAKLIRDGKLTKEKEYYVFITHTHSDHVGSLGTLQQYLYWCCGKKLNIVVSEQMKYRKEIQGVLDGFGLVPDTYQFVSEESLDDKFKSFHSIRFVRSNHGDVPIASCAIVINDELGNSLYTGDIADSTIIKEFIDYNGKNNIDQIYVDTSLTPSPVHLSLQELKETIPESLKGKVNCMHINNARIIPEIKECGFHLVSPLEGMSKEALAHLAEQLQENLEEVQAQIEKNKVKSL